MDNIRNKAAKGAVWSFIERFGLQIVGFLVTLALSRLLTPSDYGTVALLSIFTCIVGNLMDAGFGEALVQKKDANELDFNSVFYFSVVASLIGYTILFFAAPFAAKFYNIPELKAILRVISLALVFESINSVQGAVLRRKLLFNLSFRISISSTILSAIVGVSMAFLHAGPWALVGQSVMRGAASVIISWFVIGWRPKLMFSFAALKKLLQYGWKVTFSFMLGSIYGNLYGVLIGKFYSRADLAFVDRGNALPRTFMCAVNSSIENVTFPLLAQMQDERERFKATMRRIVQASTFLIFPMMVGLAICAPRLMPLLYGNQWDAAIPYMQLICFQFAIRPFHAVNLRAILALGRSDVFLKLEIIKKAIGLIALLLVLPFGVMPFMIVSTFVNDPLCVIINSWPNRKLLGYTIGEQVKDVIPSAIVSVVMGIAVFPVGLLGFHNIVTLILQVLLGVCIYGLISFWLRLRPLIEIAEILEPKLCVKIPMLKPLFQKLTERSR